MTTVGKQLMHGDCGMTYFAYLTRSGQMPTSIKALIDRYQIRMYDDASKWCQLSDCGTDNCSSNNNDDDVEPGQSSATVPAAGHEKSSPSPTKLFKLRVPSLTRRLSKFGKRSSSDKNKVELESATSPSDSQLEALSSAGTSVTTVLDDCPNFTSTPLSDQQKSKLNDEQHSKVLDEQKYERGNYHARTGNCQHVI